MSSYWPVLLTLQFTTHALLTLLFDGGVTTYSNPNKLILMTTEAESLFLSDSCVTVLNRLWQQIALQCNDYATYLVSMDIPYSSVMSCNWSHKRLDLLLNPLACCLVIIVVAFYFLNLISNRPGGCETVCMVHYKESTFIYRLKLEPEKETAKLLQVPSLGSKYNTHFTSGERK